MLPSRGFFKKNDCPFFEKGLCVRPHCHFRHRKKVLNAENSSSLDSQEDLITETFANTPLVNSINSEKVSRTSSSSTDKTQEHSSSNEESKDQSSDSLFAKLVNQANSYEKVNRHIPCAYTPTPQIRGVQLKNKTLSSTNILSSSSTLCEKQTLQTNFYSPNINLTEGVNKIKVKSLNQQNSILSSNLISILENKNLECYEPQPTTKSEDLYVDENEISSSYVPSKITTEESKYLPSDDTSLPANYVPSKEKSIKCQYVPETTGGSKTSLDYKPSNITSRETQYQPENHNLINDYVPTEKSSKSGRPWPNEKKNSGLIRLKSISPDIEMQEVLKNKTQNGGNETDLDKATAKTDFFKIIEKEIKIGNSHGNRDKSSKSHHSSSSRDKSKSSHSSKSKNTGSSSSRSGGSSRLHSNYGHHSSSKSNSSDKHKISSGSHKTTDSNSKKLSSVHKDHKSHRSKCKSKDRSKYREDEEKKDNKNVNKKKQNEMKILSSEEDGNCDFGSDCGNSLEESSKGSESDAGCKKRKNEWNDDSDRSLKHLKKSEEDLYEVFDEDPETIEKQCLEIFNSYSSDADDQKKSLDSETPMSFENYETSSVGKKRTAHTNNLTLDHSVLRYKTAKKSVTIKSAQEVMLQRYKAIEKEKEKEIQALQSTPQPSPILGLGRPSIRIAAVSNIQQMLQAKKAIQDKINKGLKVNERTTIAQTVARGGSRVAHTPPKKELVERPTVSGGTKQVPQVKRQIYLDKLLLETSQIYPTKSEAAEKALEMEEEVFKANSGSHAAYHAAFISALMKIRRRISAVKGKTSKSSALKSVSHCDVLAGGKKNYSVIKTKKVDLSMLSDRHIYEELLRCKLTPEELKENGYPIEGNKPGYATCLFNFDLKYNSKYLHIKKLTGNQRYCVRCSKQYLVDPETLQQYKEGPETCCYHPGKKKSGGRNCDRIYNCCNSSMTEGCATHVRHVTDCNDYENLPNCVKTLSKENLSNPGVFALDCEMVYTRLGYELARVTVVNLKKEIVYDTLVKPKYPIECYNTFYSGIEEKMMEGVETTLKDVQAVLLSMFSDKTILIGHSLDSDLRALHLIHETVVDTAIVYKNEKYHPYKYSLKDLCARKISKIIQENVGGHDSAEDAIAALEIMLNHVKEEVSKYDSLESYEADRQ